MVQNGVPFRSYMVLQEGEVVAEWNSPMPAPFAAAKGTWFDDEYLKPAGQDVMDTSRSAVHSITKVFTGMLFGVMKGDPSVDLDLDETLGEIFADAPEPGCTPTPGSVGYSCQIPWSSPFGESEKAQKMKKITIKELLTMTSGLTSPAEPFMYALGVAGGSDLTDSFASMSFGGPTPLRWGNFTYLSDCNILSYVILAKTGKTPKQYAESKVQHSCCSACHLVLRVFSFSMLTFVLVQLLGKLGIGPEDIPWTRNKGGSGVNDGAIEMAYNGMFLSTETMAKIGQLYLQKGASASNQQVVPSEWIEETLTPQVKIDFSFLIPGVTDYGYFMLLRGKSYVGLAHAGNYIYVDPTTKRVIVTRIDGSSCTAPCEEFDDFQDHGWVVGYVFQDFIDLAAKLPSSDFSV